MKAFVTGGTGLIGKCLVQRLVYQGYDVTCLVRQPDQATELRELGTAFVQGDVTEREPLRQGMAGADVVFHCASWYEIGLSPHAKERMERITVDGTESVLGLAVELGVPKIVYTSTVAVLGDTHCVVVDETYRRASPFDNAYDRTIYQAHQVARRYIAQGAPVIIVMPGAAYGPGDHSIVGAFLRLLLRRMLLVLPAADTGFSFVYVDDVAQGHVLAAEKGQVGESYILGGDVMTVGDALGAVARLAGVPAPLLLLDSNWTTPLRPVASWLERYIPLPSLLSSDVLGLMGRTWWVSSGKAQRDLGYTHRQIEEGMAETVIWEAAQLRSQPSLVDTKTLLALMAGVGALGALLLRGRRK
jgi:nucleoside-diphosphate-sugar epimerase